jgi:hypothetical protein
MIPFCRASGMAGDTSKHQNSGILILCMGLFREKQISVIPGRYTNPEILPERRKQ